MPRQSPVSQPRPQQQQRRTSNVRILGERFIVRFVNDNNKRVLKDVKIQSIEHKRALKLGHDTLRTLKDSGHDVDGIKVNVIGVTIR